MRKKTKLSCLVVLIMYCCFANISYALNDGIDSLLIKAEESLSDYKLDNALHYDQLIAFQTTQMSGPQRLRYYQFKAALEGKKGNTKGQLAYYQKALDNNVLDDPLIKAVSHYGFAMAFRDSLSSKSIFHAEKSLDFAVEADNGTWIKHAGTYLYKYYQEQGNREKVIQTLSKLENAPLGDASSRLAQAKVLLDEGELKTGIAILQQLVIEDPTYESVSTFYALMRLTSFHLGLRNFEKAKEIIDILMLQKERFSKENMASIYYFQAQLKIGVGQSSEAKAYFEKAVELQTDKELLEILLLKLYFLTPDKNQFTKMYNLDLIQNTVTGRALTHLIRLAANGDSQDSFDKAAQIVMVEESIDLDRRIDIIEELLTFPVAGRSKVISERLLRTMSDLKTQHFDKQRKMITSFAEAQNYSFSSLMKSTLSDLESKEKVLKEESAKKRLYLRFGGLFFILLVLVTFFLAKTFYDKRKITRLSGIIQKNNKELANYNEEYETLLMILSHQVKQPLNQLHYSFDGMKKGLQSGDTSSMKNMIHEIGKSTGELSNRVNIILSLIKSSIWEKEIPIKKIDIYKLLTSRLSFYEDYFSVNAISIDIRIQDEVAAYSNEQSLAVIFDNLFENIRKYGASGDQLLIDVQQENGLVTMELKNTISKTSKYLDLLNEATHQKSKASFGLGLEIVRKLCKKLGIGFDYNSDNHIFKTRLTLSSHPHSI